MSKKSLITLVAFAVLLGLTGGLWLSRIFGRIPEWSQPIVNILFEEQRGHHEPPKTVSFNADSDLLSLAKKPAEFSPAKCPAIWAKAQAVASFSKTTSEVHELPTIRICLLQRGWSQLHESHWRDAEETFTALFKFLTPLGPPRVEHQEEIDPELLALAHLGMAQALYFREDYPLATFHAHKALAFNARLSQAYTLLARIAYAQENLLESLTLLELAERFPVDERGKKLIAQFKKQVTDEVDLEQAYAQITSTHFTVKFDANHFSPEVAQDILKELEDVFTDLERDLGFAPSRNISVVVYDSSHYFSIAHAPLWSAAVYDGKIRLPLNAQTPPTSAAGFRATIRHEATHAFLHQGLAISAPAWFEEGLAEWIGGNFAASDWGKLLEVANQGESLDFINDDSSSFANLEAEEAHLAYLQAYAIVDYLHSRSGWFGLRSLLDCFSQKHLKGLAAVEEVYHWDREQLQQNLGTYISERVREENHQ